jgi:eukaryotic-like serine/threonine-protein kinase
VPGPATTNDFLEIVVKSGVVSERALAIYWKHLPAAEQVLPPEELAEVLIRDRVITHFQAEHFLLGKFRGLILGQYKVLERLGQGGMARVYLCEHPQHGRVAMKVLPKNFAKDAEYLQRFYREAQATARLDHPNIVRAIEIHRDENRHFLVMEYVDGALLADLVSQSGPFFQVERACTYARQTAQGLQHLHQAGLVHRDIKPSNLIVDRSGTVKILDLGLALIVNSAEVLTLHVLGTPDYLAPEQCRDSHRVDIRADIYSLGATLFFLLTGRPPFPDGDPVDKLLSHQTKEPPSIRSLRPDVPAELDQVVMRMLAKLPAERFPTPADVAVALQPWARAEPWPPAEAELPRLSPKAQASETDANLFLTPLKHSGSSAPGDRPLPPAGPDSAPGK